MQRKFVTNLALVIFINLLVKPFWILGVDRAVQNTVGAQNYGLYYTLFNFSFIFSILLDLGVTNFNSRSIARDQHLLSGYLSNITFIKILLAAVYFGITLTWAVVSGYKEVEIQWLIILACNQMLNSFILYYRSNLAGLHLFKTDSLISILDKLLMILFCIPMLTIPFLKAGFTIEWFIYAQTAAFLITAVVAGLLVHVRAEYFKLKFDRAMFSSLLKESYPYALMVLLMSVYNKIDTVMMERMLPDGDRETGLYAYAYRLLDAASMIAFLFSGLLLPMFARMIKQKQNVQELVKTSFSLLMIPSIVLAVTCFFYQQEVMELMYRSDTEYSSKIFGWLMFSFVAVANSYIFGTLITALGNIRLLNLISFTGVALNVLLNLWFLPRYGALGAAYTSLITFAAVTIWQTIYSIRQFNIPVAPAKLLRFGLFLVGAVFVAWMVKGIVAHWMLKAAACFTSGLLLALMLKLIPLKAVLQQFRGEIPVSQQ